MAMPTREQIIARFVEKRGISAEEAATLADAYLARAGAPVAAKVEVKTEAKVADKPAPKPAADKPKAKSAPMPVYVMEETVYEAPKSGRSARDFATAKPATYAKAGPPAGFSSAFGNTADMRRDDRAEMPKVEATNADRLGKIRETVKMKIMEKGGDGKAADRLTDDELLSNATRWGIEVAP